MSDFSIWARNAVWPGATRTPAASGSDDRSAGLGWSDDPSLGAGFSIVGDPSLSARGLSVGQHAERVLMHLRGERDAGG
ncbi:hypothetical protein [Piscinibacter sp. XHJ-5]|uniref:hypothetical protein n=1 Tax=Piscinibacter sp. XHJ-5 TaxID=3037797 RepID=UPI002452C996|nr:hypothetical protein [Piscinibacter sp. XHJ-5]